MKISYRVYDKSKALETGVNLSSEPCLFTGSAKADELRGLMSGGHVVECMSLYSYVYHMVLNDKFEFRCPALIDDNPSEVGNRKWGYEEIRKMALLNDQEKDFFEMALNQNRILSESDVRICIKGKNFVRKTATSTKTFGQSCNLIDPNNDHYGFDGGAPMKSKNKTVGDSEQGKIGGDIKFQIPQKKVGGISVPSIQKCPNCKIYIEHIGASYCKIFTCVGKYQFCFICRKGNTIINFKDGSRPGGECQKADKFE